MLRSSTAKSKDNLRHSAKLARESTNSEKSQRSSILTQTKQGAETLLLTKNASQPEHHKNLNSYDHLSKNGLMPRSLDDNKKQSQSQFDFND